MYRSLVLLSLLFLVSGCGPTVVPAARSAFEAVSEAQLDEFRESLKGPEATALDQDRTAQEWRAADAQLKDALLDPRFPRLDASDRGQIWYARGWAAFNQEDEATACAHFRKAIAEDADDAWFWLSRAQCEIGLHDKTSAASSLRTGLELEPDLIARFEGRVFEIMEGTEPGSPSVLALLRFLERQTWNSTDPRAGSVWKRLALEELHLGNRPAASAALRRIVTPDTVVRVRIDKRFDGLYDRNSAAFDVDKVSAARIVFLESQVDANPRVLKKRVELNRELIAAGRFQAVLDVYDAIEKSVAGADEDPPFGDMDEMAWVREQRGVALRHLGHEDEAFANMEKAADTETDGRANVNQALNLAERYCDGNDGAKSAAALAKAGKSLSPYGSMVFHFIEHCAASLQHDTATADRALAYLHDHREDGRLIYLHALLRVGRMEDAAREAVSRLDSERWREDMLYAVQDFPNDGTDEDSSRARWKELLDRKDVIAAVNRVGRIEKFESFGY